MTKSNIVQLPQSFGQEVTLSAAEQQNLDEVQTLNTAAKMAIQQQHALYRQQAGDVAGNAVEDPAALDLDDQMTIARAIQPMLALAESCPDPYIMNTLLRSFIFGLANSVQFKRQQLEQIAEETGDLIGEMELAITAGNAVKTNRLSELIDRKTEFYGKKQAEIEENELWSRSCKALWKRLTGEDWADQQAKASVQASQQAAAVRAMMGIKAPAKKKPAAKTTTKRK